MEYACLFTDPSKPRFLKTSICRFKALVTNGRSLFFSHRWVSAHSLDLATDQIHQCRKKKQKNYEESWGDLVMLNNVVIIHYSFLCVSNIAIWTWGRVPRRFHSKMFQYAGESKDTYKTRCLLWLPKEHGLHRTWKSTLRRVPQSYQCHLGMLTKLARFHC